MGDVVNLNKFRKRKARQGAERRAETNRRKHGRTKAERDVERQEAERSRDALEKHRLDGDDPTDDSDTP